MSAMIDSIRAAPGDRIARLRFERIAEKIEREPGLLDIPLANIARWLAQGHSAGERTIAVATVRESQIENLRSDEVLSVRPREVSVA